MDSADLIGRDLLLQLQRIESYDCKLPFEFSDTDSSRIRV